MPAATRSSGGKASGMQMELPTNYFSQFLLLYSLIDHSTILGLKFEDEICHKHECMIVEEQAMVPVKKEKEDFSKGLFGTHGIAKSRNKIAIPMK
jgi:hypothetical protein